MILKEWPFSSAVCTLYLATTSINQITSSLFLMVLSADRYIAVCHPITAPGLRTPTISRLVTSLTWIVSAIIMIPVFLFSRTVTNPVTGASSCNIYWSLDPALEDIWSFIDNHTVFTVYSFIFGFAGDSMMSSQCPHLYCVSRSVSAHLPVLWPGGHPALVLRARGLCQDQVSQSAATPEKGDH